MSPVNQYKKLEKKIAYKVKKGLYTFFQAVGAVFKKIFTLGRQHFTIMLVPHSEKRIFNFKISVFALVFLGLFSAGILGAFFWYSTSFTEMSRNLAMLSAGEESAQAKVEIYRDEISQLGMVIRRFKDQLNKTLDVIGVENPDPIQMLPGKGDLASFINFQQLEEGTMKEVGELRNIRSYLERNVEPLGQISNVLNSQKNLLANIPALWPIKGGAGRITAHFGPSIEPFNKTWYTHKGIDIADRPGTPIVATANGKIVKVDYDPAGYGNQIDILHSYGFSTKYAHLLRVLVTKGQDVVRGQVIGLLGSTGRSTGPHVHYEVRIGSQVADPAYYMNITSNVVDTSESN